MKPPLLVAHDLARHYRVSRGLLRGHATVRAQGGAPPSGDGRSRPGYPNVNA